MSRITIFIFLFLLSTVSFASIADKFSATGHARFRWETRNDVGYKAATHNNKILRFRPAFHFKTDENIKLTFEPQFSRTFGSDGQSGTVTDPSLSVHRAQIWSNWDDKVHFTIGRQALNYGDQVVISTLEWSNVARSFDALKARVFIPIAEGKIDLIDATMNTNGTSNTVADDLTLRGAYSMWSLGKYLEEMDLYYLVKNQKSNSSTQIINKLWGVRLKSNINNFDYRIEHTRQNTETRDGATADMKGQQTNAEFGYSFKWLKTRVAASWFKANDEYDHMMPLAHAYLGIADVLGRSNITGYVLHLKMSPKEKWLVKLDYHLFERDSSASDAISAGPNQVARTASSYSSASSSKKIGSEIDLQVIKQMTESSKLALGAALFMPGAYFKEYTAGESKNKDDIKFAYLQYIVKF